MSLHGPAERCLSAALTVDTRGHGDGRGDGDEDERGHKQ